ncbi:RPM1-interacting protein 4-like [Humulus lupulus]|uniref:RPM1-interacting protein 4-like n=1 Tax=Humulus lupulus TaxID=3486 RepID=UPI002B40CD76|nr:RPM1-interacting protein 4-like [Humulus lupulus]
MATSHVPKFGNWENDDVPYTAYFDNARKEKPGGGGHVRFNPNDPEENPEAFMGAMNSVHHMPLESEAPNYHHHSYNSKHYTEKSSSDNSQLRRPAGDHDHHQGRQRSPRVNVVSDHHKKKTTPSSSYSAKGISDRSSSSASDIKGHGRHTSTGCSNKNNSIENHFSDHDHHHQHHHRTTSIPKFGAWDVNDPKSGEGFTFIFEKMKEEKTNPTAKVPDIAPTPHHNYFKDQSKRSSKRSCMAKICCCFPSGGE